MVRQTKIEGLGGIAMADDKTLEKINRLSTAMGFNKGEQILLELKNTDDENIKEIHLKNGKFDSNEPWFVVDENDDKKAYAVLPLDAFNKVIDILRDVQQENFNLKLEKSIWREVPVDFDDVWIVAMDQVKKLVDKQNPDKPISVNIDKLVKDIKKEHPNLFVNMKNFFPPLLNM